MVARQILALKIVVRVHVGKPDWTGLPLSQFFYLFFKQKL
jgi:hypothetical protein